MSKSKIEKRLPEPQPKKELKADKTSVSPAIAKPNVSSSLCPSTQDLFPISKRLDLSVIDYHFSVLSTGDNEVRIPYVPLYNYLKSIEMLQAAEYQIKVLKEALSEQQPMNQ